LTDIVLKNTQVTDVGVTALAEFEDSKLSRIEIGGTQVTNKGVTTLVAKHHKHLSLIDMDPDDGSYPEPYVLNAELNPHLLAIGHL